MEKGTEQTSEETCKLVHTNTTDHGGKHQLFMLVLVSCCMFNAFVVSYCKLIRFYLGFSFVSLDLILLVLLNRVLVF